MGSLLFLLFAEILIFCFSYIVGFRDIFSPSVIMCIVFMISTMFALLNINQWDYLNTGYSMQAAEIISIGLLSFSLGELVFRVCNKTMYKRNYLKKNNLSINSITVSNRILIVFIFFNIVISLLYYREISKIVGGQGLEAFRIYRNYGIDKLAGKEGESINFFINQLTNVMVASGYIFLYVFINNIVYHNKNIINNIFLLLNIMLSTLPSIMSAGRTQILMYSSAALIYYYILWNQKYYWKKNLSAKFIKIGSIFLFIAVPAFYFSLKILGRKTKLGLFDYISDYIGSSIFLFGRYVEFPIRTKSFGEESLVGIKKILSILGFGSQSTSYNLEFRYTGKAQSNVYTFFRPLFHDFGLVGMCLLTMMIALIFSYLYWGKIKYRPASNDTNLWVIIYGFMFYWIFASSIIQYSIYYISVGAIVKIILIICLNKFVILKGEDKVK